MVDAIIKVAFGELLSKLLVKGLQTTVLGKSYGFDGRFDKTNQIKANIYIEG